MVDDVDAIALEGGHRRQRPHLAQAAARTRRQFEPARIGAIDDVDVVIARQDERALGESGVPEQDIEELHPFR